METFVVQIPNQAETGAGTGQTELRGLVEHVGSGVRRPFTDTGELLAFLAADHRRPAEEVKG